MDYFAALKETNELYKDKRASFSKPEIKALAGKTGKDAMLGFLTANYYKRTKLIQNAEIIYGYVYKDYSSDPNESALHRPTWVLFSPSGEFSSNPELYKDCVSKIHEFTSKAPSDHKLKKLYHILSNPFADADKLELPEFLSGGKLIYLSILYVYSANMPFFHLGTNMFLFAPSISKEILYLSPAYWSKSWSDFYLEKKI